jgi:hypothetical protein
VQHTGQEEEEAVKTCLPPSTALIDLGEQRKEEVEAEDQGGGQAGHCRAGGWSSPSYWPTGHAMHAWLPASLSLPLAPSRSNSLRPPPPFTFSYS